MRKLLTPFAAVVLTLVLAGFGCKHAPATDTNQTGYKPTDGTVLDSSGVAFGSVVGITPGSTITLIDGLKVGVVSIAPATCTGDPALCDDIAKFTSVVQLSGGAMDAAKSFTVGGSGGVMTDADKYQIFLTDINKTVVKLSIAKKQKPTADAGGAGSALHTRAPELSGIVKKKVADGSGGGTTASTNTEAASPKDAAPKTFVQRIAAAAEALIHVILPVRTASETATVNANTSTGAGPVYGNPTPNSTGTIIANGTANTNAVVNANVATNANTSTANANTTNTTNAAAQNAPANTNASVNTNTSNAAQQTTNVNTPATDTNAATNTAVTNTNVTLVTNTVTSGTNTNALADTQSANANVDGSTNTATTNTNTGSPSGSGSILSDIGNAISSAVKSVENALGFGGSSTNGNSTSGSTNSGDTATSGTSTANANGGSTAPATPLPPITTDAVYIKVDAPTANQVVSSPLTVTGSARGTWFGDGHFPGTLIDDNGVTIAHGDAQATGAWASDTTLYPFSMTLTFTKPATGSGILILFMNNPTGQTNHDPSISVPVKFTQ